MGRGTPLEALYALFKGEFGLSHHGLSQLILSNRPQQNGSTPRQMAANTSWLSRYVVHAPMDSLQDRYFADFTTSARRVHAHLNQTGHADEEIFNTICDSRLMASALDSQGQSGIVYRNALARLRSNAAATAAEHARAALVLTITAGCTANIARAIDLTSGYIHTNAQVNGRFTPQPSAVGASAQHTAPHQAAPGPIGLIRLVDGRVASNPYVVPATADGSVIGALALGANAIADVEPDVSAEHLRVWREKGRWLARDLGSTNGTTLLPADGGTPRLLSDGMPVELHPGDHLRLGATTTFVVVAVAQSLQGGGDAMTSRTNGARTAGARNAATAAPAPNAATSAPASPAHVPAIPTPQKAGD